MDEKRLFIKDLLIMDNQIINVFIKGYGYFKAVINIKNKRVLKLDAKQYYWNINRFTEEQEHIKAFRLL